MCQVDLEVDGNLYVSGSITPFPTSNTLYVDETNHKVGINVPNPSEELEVSGNVIIRNDTSAILSLKSGEGSDIDCLINMYENDNLKWTLRNQGDNDDRFYIQSSSGGTQKRFTIEQGGNVGIGQPDPSQKLHIGTPNRAYQVI